MTGQPQPGEIWIDSRGKAFHKRTGENVWENPTEFIYMWNRERQTELTPAVVLPAPPEGAEYVLLGVVDIAGIQACCESHVYLSVPAFRDLNPPADERPELVVGRWYRAETHPDSERFIIERLLSDGRIVIWSQRIASDWAWTREGGIALTTVWPHEYIREAAPADWADELRELCSTPEAGL